MIAPGFSNESGETRIPGPLRRVLWQCAGRWCFRATFHNWYRVRELILQMFGARAGPHTKIRRTVRIDQPWNFTAGELVMIGDDASFVAVRPIRLGNFAVVSQMANVVTEVLDVRRPDGARFQGAVTIESQCWVAADALVLPGTHLKEGAVVGARSVAQGEVSAWTVVAGDPARFLRPRPWKGTTGAAR